MKILVFRCGKIDQTIELVYGSMKDISKDLFIDSKLPVKNNGNGGINLQIP